MSEATAARPYRLVDEPTPGRLAPLIVSPMWCFMAFCLGGSWIALPWYVVNSRALGSATARRELLLALLSPLASIAFVVLALGLIDVLGLHGQPPAALLAALGLPDRAGSYAAVFLIALKQAFNYALVRHQMRGYDIWLSAGGSARNAVAVVIVARVLRPIVLTAAFDASFWLGVVVI